MKEILASKKQFSSSPQAYRLNNLMALEITENGYAAEVTIHKTAKDVAFVIMDIREYLQMHRVTSGILDPAIDEVIKILKSGPVPSKIVIARGKPLEEGREGIEDYKFRIKLLAGKITEKKIDFRERGLINVVEAKQVIAQIKPEIPGKPGILVTGDVENPKPVRHIMVPKAGANVTQKIEGEQWVYTANISGHARLLFDEIQVNPDLVILGDLDYTKGNIEFTGNVEITGSVKSGFSVIAGGDIIVGGDVEQDACLRANGNVIVRKTISCGREKGEVFAGGSVTGNRIVNSKIICNSDVFVKEIITESVVCCNGKFATSWAQIVGVEVEAIGGIVVNTVGMENGNAKNVLHAGSSFRVNERLLAIDKELERVRNELQLLSRKTEVETGYHQEEFSKLSVQEQERVKRMGLSRGKLTKTLKEQETMLQKERIELVPRVRDNPSARIEIKGCVYPACTIKIGTREITVLDKKMNSCVLMASEA